jgi:hypothetical protein
VCISAKRRTKSVRNEDFLIESTVTKVPWNSWVSDVGPGRTDFNSSLFYQQFCNESSKRFVGRKIVDKYPYPQLTARWQGGLLPKSRLTAS